MIKAVIFDCWGTLFYVDPHPFSVLAEEVGASLGDYEFIKEYEKAFMLDRHDDIKPSIQELLSVRGLSVSEERIKQIEVSMLDSLGHQRAFPDTEPALQTLSKTYQIGMITNAWSRAFENLRKTQRLGEKFKTIVTSYEFHAVKPSPILFREDITRLGVSAGEAVMVGDSLPDDIKAAQKQGIQAILLDRKDRHPGHPDRITNLNELPTILSRQTQSGTLDS